MTFIVLWCGSTVDLRWVISTIFFLPEAWTFSVATETQAKRQCEKQTECFADGAFQENVGPYKIAWSDYLS